MRRIQTYMIGALLGVALLASGILAFSRRAQAITTPAGKLVVSGFLGGPRGLVRIATGAPVSGVMVQLISQKTSIRTTVYTGPEGRYEFPELEPGQYTLRIARPLEFKPYVRDSVQINGPADMEDIVLERVSKSEFLPPTREILAQLTDAEWMYNLPGTAEQKKVFMNTCAAGCHSFLMQFSSRFDEKSWNLIMHRMLDYRQRILVTPQTEAQRRNSPSGLSEEDRNTILHWLSSVRGPDAVDPPIKVFPRPEGPATRAIITEYELPWVGVNVHDVTGDKEGNIWFDINRSPYLGKLDPRTGKITAYRSPDTPGRNPGMHWLKQAQDGSFWFTETWAENLVHFSPVTGEFKKIHGFEGNTALSPDGTIWRTNSGKIVQYDPETGQPLHEYPMQHISGTYGNNISADGAYFGGGSPGMDFDGMLWFNTLTHEMKEVRSPSGVAKPSRASIDPEGNVWAGGRGGMLVKLDRRTGTVSEYTPPTPYTNFYEATADKNGEIWAGEMRAGRIARFNPRTYQWTEYVMPEPYSFDWRTWVDNSTDPVTVWYGDQYGYIVRIQPLE